MPTNWLPVFGDLQVTDTSVHFSGASAPAKPGVAQEMADALIMSSQFFGGGTISATIEFLHSVEPDSTCGIVLFRQPSTHALIEAQIGGLDLHAVWTHTGEWRRINGVGSSKTLQPNKEYKLAIRAAGSTVVSVLNGVELLTSTLPVPLPRSNAGLWFNSKTPIRVSDFVVSGVAPKAFVVMQFTPPYDELYAEVIKPVCDSLGLKAERADETFGPGVIIQDIERKVLEARVIIADITPQNLNVYYEVGYAHALKKDTILIAERPLDLPFDVSSFRVLSYENSIGGKAKVETGLRQHLEEILREGL